MMKLYGIAVSPFVMRVMLAARHKGVDLDCEDFPGGTASAGYLALNPIGKIPLLVDGDFALPESAVIVEYLDTVLDGPPLVPADARAAAQARLIVQIVDLYLMPEIRGLVRGREAPDGVAPAIAALMPVVFFFDVFKSLGSGAILDAVPGLAGWWSRAKTSDLGVRAGAEQYASMRARFAAAA